jgi:hypothetical protein
MRLVTEAKFGANFGGSYIIAEQNDFHFRVQKSPAL